MYNTIVMSDEKRAERDEKLEEVKTDEFEDTEIEDAEANVEKKIKKLRQKLQGCEEEKRKYLDDLQRSKADFLNARKRLEDERIRDKERAVNALINDLLPLCDSFFMAMSNTRLWESVNKEWRQGMEGIKNQLDNILNSYQVSSINPSGADFDPVCHEAVSKISVKTKDQDNKVVEVIQLGYERNINGQTELIRPARVTVGHYENQ